MYDRNPSHASVTVNKMIESEDFLRDPERIIGGAVRVVVPISGGKDSQACMKLAVAEGSSGVVGLFCDTQFEHPWTYEHVDRISELYGVPIVRVCDGRVDDLVAQQGRFPSGTARFCTDQLKIIPSKKFYKSLAELNGGFEVWYGVRSNESKEREKRYISKVAEEVYMPHEVMPGNYPKYLGDSGVRFRLAILDWTSEEVFRFLEGSENKLYKYGFDRVGCFPCLAAGDETKMKAFSFDEFGVRQFALVKELEEITDKSVFNGKAGRRWNTSSEQPDFQGCSICAM